MLVVTYTCDSCGIRDRGVPVEERAPESDVVRWMRQTVAVAVSYDHSQQSPGCHVSAMANVKIPMNDREYIGGPKKHG